LGLPVQIGTPIPGSRLELALGSAANPSLTFLGDTNTGIFSPAADTIAFTEGGTEVARFDSSANFGVGTSSPGAKLDVNGSIRGTGLTVNGSGIVGGANQTTLDFLSGTGSRLIAWGANTSTRGSLRIAMASSDASAYLEAATIDSSGNLLVGTTSNFGFANPRVAVTHGIQDYALGVTNSNSSIPYGIIIRYTASSPNNTGAVFLYFDDTTTNRFTVRSNGGIANFSANNVNLSDRREKTNFAPAGEYLSKICAIPVQTFNYIDQNMEDDPGLTLGVVAQDVQEVAPELVMESNWAGKDEEPKMRLSIYQTDLQYALMKCIQELKAELDATKAEVALLKGAA
jgi:hypothetical protein